MSVSYIFLYIFSGILLFYGLWAQTSAVIKQQKSLMPYLYKFGAIGLLMALIWKREETAIWGSLAFFATTFLLLCLATLARKRWLR